MAKEIYTLKASASCTNTTEQTVLCDAPEGEEYIVWSRICAIAVDDQPDLITIFARHGASDYILDIAQNSPSGAGFAVYSDVVLPASWQIGAKFAVATSGKLLQVFAFGRSPDFKI